LVRSQVLYPTELQPREARNYSRTENPGLVGRVGLEPTTKGL
jgi:hypothetical protein